MIRALVIATLAVGACAPSTAPSGIRVANVAGWLAVAGGVAIVAVAPQECQVIPGVVGAMECSRAQGPVVLGMSLAIVGLGVASFTAFGLK